MKHKNKFEKNDAEIEFTGERVVPNKTPYYVFQQHINRYHFASNLAKNKVVLDIACGTGYGSYYLIKNGAKKVVGLDISEEAINYAKNNYKNLNLTFITGDSKKLPFKNEHFDIIVSFETIEHVNEYKKFLNECKRVLNEEGVFVCSTPNKRYTSTFINEVNPYHVKEFYPEEFQNLINEYFPYTKLYGQENINIIKKKCIIKMGKLISFVPDDIKNTIIRSNLNKTSSKKTESSINEYYKVTEFLNSKLIISEFLVITAKKNAYSKDNDPLIE